MRRRARQAGRETRYRRRCRSRSRAHETRDESILTFKRSDLGATAIQVGDTFKEEPGTAYYRVTRLVPRPSDVLVKFHCEAVIR